MTQEAILAWFSQYAYQPLWVYGGVVFLMFISAFGFPLPEEVPLIGVGLVAYMARNPETFPPPENASGKVEMFTAAAISFVAVIASDYLVFYLGRYSARHLETRGWFQRMVKPEAMLKLREWTQKYGMWACGLFRFTPGLRFPGFMASGALGIRTSQFLLVDGTAALISVPTQVILVACYGETILKYFKDMKLVLGCLLLIGVSIYLARKGLRAWRRAQAA